jgi:hypothetical protein
MPEKIQKNTLFRHSKNYFNSNRLIYSKKLSFNVLSTIRSKSKNTKHIHTKAPLIRVVKKTAPLQDTDQYSWLNPDSFENLSGLNA